MSSDSGDDEGDVYAQSYHLGHDQDDTDSRSGSASENETGIYPDDSQGSSDSDDGFQRAITANGGAADSTSSESSSDSDASQPLNRRHRNRFLDLEASESECESTAESFADWDDSDALLSASFTDFMRLPVELREMIWTEFCPDLQSQPRVFEFISSGNDYIVPSPQMEFQTEPTRMMLGTHRESRRLALRSCPDHIRLPHGAAYVPYNKERDIIYLDVSMNHRGPAPDNSKCLARMAPGMQNLAIPADCVREDWTTKLPYDLPSLRNVFVLAEAVDICTRGLTWCASKSNLEYRFDFEETGLGIGVEITSMLFCWPNTNKLGRDGEAKFKRHVGQIVTYPWNRYESPEPEDPDFEGLEPTGTEHPGETKARSWGRRMNELRKRFSVKSAGASVSSGLTPAGDCSMHPSPSVWPMVRFMDDDLERLQEIKDWQLPWKDWVSEEGSSEETDEYESDGIDDFQYDDDILPTDIEDEFGADIPDDGLPLASDTEDETTAHRLDQSTHEELSADADDQEDDSSDTSRGLDRNGTARPRHNILDSDSDKGDSDEKAARSNDRLGIGKRRARPIVVDSDSDGDDGDEDPSAVATRNHVDKRRRRAVLSDSDSQDEDSDASDGQDDHRSHRSAKRRKIVASLSGSEDEDEDDQDSVAPRPNKIGNRRARDSVSSSSESEQDSSASSDEDKSSGGEPTPKSKKPSLAKRLQMEYRQARADYDAEHDSSDDGNRASSQSRRQFVELDGTSSDDHGSTINTADEAQEEEEDEEDDDIDEEDW